MQNYILSCCSTVDLTSQYLENRNIPYKSFHFFLDEEEHLDDMFSSNMKAEEFYNYMVEGKMTKTAQVNVEEYCEFFEELLTKADELVHIVFSSGLSGSFNSARIAVETLKEKLPNKKIYIVVSLCASSGYGLFMDMLADKRDEGVSAKELYEYAENLKLSIRHDFYSTDLTFYVRGGRVSKTAGFFGNILKICPVLDMNNEGKLIVRKKAHGRVKAREEMLASMLANAKDGRNNEGKCFISHSNCLDEAQKLVALLEMNFENLQGQIKIFSIGPTIGSHTGPGTVALFYVGAERGE